MIIGRIFGWLFLAMAIAVLGWDLSRMGETDEGFALAATGQVWHELHSGSLQLSQAGIQRHVSPWLWADVIQPVLEMPAVLVFGVLGLILVLLFRSRDRKKSPRREPRRAET